MHRYMHDMGAQRRRDPVVRGLPSTIKTCDERRTYLLRTLVKDCCQECLPGFAAKALAKDPTSLRHAVPHAACTNPSCLRSGRRMVAWKCETYGNVNRLIIFAFLSRRALQQCRWRPCCLWAHCGRSYADQRAGTQQRNLRASPGSPEDARIPVRSKTRRLLNAVLGPASHRNFLSETF